MNKIRHLRLTPMLLLSAALLLRAVIPAGYMPAGAGSGLLFEFCPEGAPAGFMQPIAGDAGHDHHHAVDGNDGASSDDDHHCPMGHMLLSAAAMDDAWQAELTLFSPAPIANAAYAHISASRTRHQPRGPPA